MPGVSEDVRAEEVRADPRWTAVCSRASDVPFLYAVTTTGVYCRPSCAARRPHPRNVEFYDAPLDAERAGYRPCKRCRPGVRDPQLALLESVCRRIEEADQPLRLEDLAEAVELSPSHLHRLFKKHLGLTPAAYTAAHRAGQLRRALQGQTSITDAIYEAGYASSGRFYEESNRILGMTPTAFRRQGQGERVRFALGECNLGSVLVGSTRRGVCAIMLGDDPEAVLADFQRSFQNAELAGDDPDFDDLVARVVGMLEAGGGAIDLPLDIRGTAFQKRVWDAISKIPPGATTTYAALAKAIGRPTAARAVAQACGANKLAVAIPCHRVVRADGSPSGYRWGLARKRELLARESERRST